jgi:glucose/arabinose dehydrogenase
MKTRLGRRVAVVTMAAAVLSAGLPGAVAAGGEPTLNTQVIQSGLSIPWDVAFTPDGRMLVTERSGFLKIFANAEPGAALLLSMKVGHVKPQGEAGLMGIAVDRNFATNHRIYVCVSRDEKGQWLNQVLRYRIDDQNGVWFEKFVIRYGMAAGNIHNGCAIEMLSDNMLWVTMGDGGVMSRAQNPNSLNGKILRVTPDGGVPSNNPIIGGRRTLVYSMGHRNPQGITTRPSNGAVYAIEHGPDINDEINRIWPGGNFGWPCYTGNGQRYSPYPGPCGPASSYRNPAWSSGGSTWATSNGSFLSHPAWGSWNGQLVVATLKEMDLRHYTPVGASNNVAWDGTQWLNDTWRKRSVVRGPGGGTLYFTTSNGTNDRVVRITPS